MSKAAAPHPTNAATHERPILFSAPMVRALLAGHKTQTRRVIKPQWPADTDISEHSSRPGYWLPYSPDGRLRNGLPGSRPNDCGITCPYGIPGDRLWVREAGYLDRRESRFWVYRATPNVCTDISVNWPTEAAYTWQTSRTAAPPADEYRLVPSIHMPRHASRILLEVTRVRAERLHAITEDDARAEGSWTRGMKNKPRVAFQRAWNAINAHPKRRAYRWNRDPWVWAVDFRVLRPTPTTAPAAAEVTA